MTPTDYAIDLVLSVMLIFIYYPLILYINVIIESPVHFTRVAMSYMILLAAQMFFFLVLPVTTPEHWRAYNRGQGASERLLAFVQRLDARSNGYGALA